MKVFQRKGLVQGVDMADFAMDEEVFHRCCSNNLRIYVLKSIMMFKMTFLPCFQQVFAEELPEKDRKFLNLVEMGFTLDETSSAIDRCGNY